MINPNLSQSSPDNQRLEVLSVDEFFQQVNWYGSLFSSLNDTTLGTIPYETVGQFFSTFPWQGSTTAQLSKNWDETREDNIGSIDSDTLTLEDLSALF